MKVHINVEVHLDAGDEANNRANMTEDQIRDALASLARKEQEALKARVEQAVTSLLLYGEDRSYITEDL